MKNRGWRSQAILFALILAWMVPTWGYAKSSAEVPFARDFQRDAKVSETKQLPILVVFTRPNCPYCMRVLKEFLEPMRRNAQYHRKVIMRRVDMSSDAKLRDFSGGITTHREFALENGVGMVPVILLYDSWGDPLATPLLGFSSPDYYGDFLDRRINEALIKIRK